jgi:hypothetical protein
MDRDFEMDQIRFAAECIKNHFEKYLIDCKEHWPKCPFHDTTMCQVIKKDSNTYYQCFEFDDENKMCGHKEYGI